ncbi:hypothetical protein D3C85_1302640 [compost metagenome]
MHEQLAFASLLECEMQARKDLLHLGQGKLCAEIVVHAVSRKLYADRLVCSASGFYDTVSDSSACVLRDQRSSTVQCRNHRFRVHFFLEAKARF